MFSSCEKSSELPPVFTAVGGWALAIWHIRWGSRRTPWCGHSAARHSPSPGQCPPGHSGTVSPSARQWSSSVAANRSSRNGADLPSSASAVRIKLINHLGSQFYFLAGSLQWAPWSHFELLTWTKQDKGTNTEEQEVRVTIKFLNSDSNRSKLPPRPCQQHVFTGWSAEENVSPSSSKNLLFGR